MTVRRMLGRSLRGPSRRRPHRWGLGVDGPKRDLERLENRSLLAGLVVSEIHYHPPSPTAAEIAAGFTRADDFAFIELTNVSTSPLDLTSYRLLRSPRGGRELGVAFDGASSSVGTLEPGRAVVVVANANAFAARYGSGPLVAGTFVGQLTREDVPIVLARHDELVQQFRYDAQWYPATDGAGYSLELRDPHLANPHDTDPETWSNPAAWAASSIPGGTPGNDAQALGIVGDVNGDGRFNRRDLEIVTSAGKYATGAAASFAEGDWNQDGVFDSHDLVLAMETTLFDALPALVAMDDQYMVPEDGELTVTAGLGVIANDLVSPAMQPTAQLVVPPLFGTLQLQRDGALHYVPNVNFSGVDRFAYTLDNGLHATSRADVHLIVTPLNDAPLALADFFFTQPGTPLSIPAANGVLANDRDQDGDRLMSELVEGPKHGMLTLQHDGSFQYAPRSGFAGIDRFVYRVTDGTDVSERGTVTISVNRRHVVVSELAAAVQNSFRDYDNDSSDWIEVANVDSVDVDLQGWYLTDDLENLTKWRVPVTTVLAPGEARIIVASGKNTVAPTGELHTNFRLSSDGEYLALVEPDGTTVVWETYPLLPALHTDVAYGLAATTLTQPLVNYGSAASFALEAPQASDGAWTAVEFNDDDWQPGTAAMGYAVQTSPRLVRGFSARMLKVGGGLVTWLETAEAAEGLFDGTARALDYTISRDDTVIVPQVNFGGIVSTSASGDFPEALPYPDGTTSYLQDDFALRVTATVTIPEGDWSIGFGSSDGGLLRLDGVEFVETTGEAGSDERLIAGDGELLYNETRNRGWTTGFLRAPVGGMRTSLEVISFERRGADFLEVAIAPGHVTGTPSTRRGWSLLGDGVEGWQVETIQMPQQAPYGPLLRTNVATAMHQQHQGIMVRIPFDVTSASDMNQLHLSMRYDDGFVAYLNGHEIVRDNVVMVADGLFRAASDRRADDALQVVSFDVSDHRHLLRDGTNVLAIHGTTSDADATEFLLAPELTAVRLAPRQPSYLVPSPGAANGSGAVGSLAAPEFSGQSGAFFESFTLTIASPDPAATIRYTLDGSIPNERSAVYHDPIPIHVSTEVRARAFRTDYLPSATATRSFVRMASDLRDFSSNVPILVVDTLVETVPETSSTLYASSVAALFDVDQDGRSSLGAMPTLISRAGFKERGSSSSSYPQKPYRIEFRQDESDADRTVELLGLTPESDFALVPGYQFDRSINRNAIIYDLSNQAGAYATATRYVEVFVNSARGEVTHADYVGLYPLIETIKIDPGRLDIGSLSPQYTQEPEITGGYLLKIDRPAPGDVGITVGPENHRVTFQLVDPDETELRTNEAQLNYLSQYLTDFLTALFAPDFRHPETGQHYGEWTDIPSLVDHYLLYEFWQATDALFFSGHWYKPRDGKLHAGPIWDFDRSIGSTDGRNVDPTGWDAVRSAPLMWPRLFEDLEFRQAMIDRWSELQAEVLSLPNVLATFDRITQPLAEAAARNFERWPLAPPRSGGGLFGVLDGTWEGEVEHMRQSVMRRHHWIDSRFMAPPVLRATPSSTDDNAMVVTLLGDMNGDARVEATDMAVLSRYVREGQDVALADLTDDGTLDADDLARLANLLDTIVGDANLDGRVNELDQAIFDQYVGQPQGETMPGWAEADFDGDGDVDQADGQLLQANLGFDRHETIPTGKSIYFTTDGTDPRMPGGGVSPAARQFTGSLTIAGPVTILARAYDPEFNIPEAGFQQQTDDVEAWSGMTMLQIESPVVTPVQALRITEINYHPADPTASELAAIPEVDANAFEFLKLTNVAGAAISLAEVRFTSGVAFDFLDSTIPELGPGQSLYIVSDIRAFQHRYGSTLPVAGVYTGQLNNGGERLSLAYEDQVVQEFEYSDRWYVETDGGGAFLQMISPAEPDLAAWNDASRWRSAERTGA